MCIHNDSSQCWLKLLFLPFFADMKLFYSYYLFSFHEMSYFGFCSFHFLFVLYLFIVDFLTLATNWIATSFDFLLSTFACTMLDDFELWICKSVITSTQEFNNFTNHMAKLIRAIIFVVIFLLLLQFANARTNAPSGWVHWIHNLTFFRCFLSIFCVFFVCEYNMMRFIHMMPYVAFSTSCRLSFPIISIVFNSCIRAIFYCFVDLEIIWNQSTVRWCIAVNVNKKLFFLKISDCV